MPHVTIYLDHVILTVHVWLDMREHYVKLVCYLNCVHLISSGIYELKKLFYQGNFFSVLSKDLYIFMIVWFCFRV